MIDRDGECYRVCCDNCYEEVTIDNCFGVWNDMLKELKRLGWKIRKTVENEFEHLCPACVKEAQKKVFETTE